MGISGEVRLVVSLALFAIAGFIFYRFRYYLEWDRELREFAWPKDMPRHVKVGIAIAIGLIFVGAFISPSPL
jgi:hypothetical protein